MTDQMPIVTKRAKPIDRLARDIAPPLAPLVMPTQVLQPADGFIRHAATAMVARLALLKHSFRRAG